MKNDRAKQFLKDLGDKAGKHADAWEAHQNDYFDVAKSVIKGDFTAESLFADALKLTLGCYGLVYECVLPGGPGSSSTFADATTEIVLDQRSEMGVPVRFPALDGPSGAPQLLSATGTSGGVPVANARARVLASGEAWASLVDLIAITPTLPVGAHSVQFGSATLSFSRVARPEGNLLFGSGSIPPELAGDPSLGLGELL